MWLLRSKVLRINHSAFKVKFKKPDFLPAADDRQSFVFLSQTFSLNILQRREPVFTFPTGSLPCIHPVHLVTHKLCEWHSIDKFDKEIQFNSIHCQRLTATSNKICQSTWWHQVLIERLADFSPFKTPTWIISAVLNKSLNFLFDRPTREFFFQIAISKTHLELVSWFSTTSSIPVEIRFRLRSVISNFSVL